MRRKISVFTTRPFRFCVACRSVASLVCVAVFVGAFFGSVRIGTQRVETFASASVLAQEEPLDLSVLDDADSSAAPPVPSSSPPSGTGATNAAASDGSTNSGNSASGNSASSDAASGASTSERAGFWKLVRAGGWIGAILLAASILAVSLAIRLALALRRSVFAPPALEATVAERLLRNDRNGALSAASESDSFFGRVAAAGLREADRGWPAVEKALEDAISEETAAFYRKTEPLATIGNVAPMLGLLGTVVGMVATFGELAVADAGGRNLANGIYFALVTTVDGLIVAIPVLVVHSLLNGRVASLAAECATKIERIFSPLKRLATPSERVRPSEPDVSKTPQTLQTPSIPQTRSTPQTSPSSRTPQVAPTPPTRRTPQVARTSNGSPSVASEPGERSTATPGLEEITPPRAGTRPTLSLKPKQNE